MLPVFITPRSGHRSLSQASSSSTVEGTTGYDLSTINRTFDDSRDEGALLQPLSKFWIRVTHADNSISAKFLADVFRSYGGENSFVHGTLGKVSGYVGFGSRETALAAAFHWSHTVPSASENVPSASLVMLDEVVAAQAAAASCVPPESMPGDPGEVKSTHSRMNVRVSSPEVENHDYSDSPCAFNPEEAVPLPPLQGSSRDALYVLISESASISDCAHEMVAEVKHATPAMVRHLAYTLSTLPPGMPAMHSFREELTKQLLYELVQRDERDPVAAIQCGTFLGELFVGGLLTGDPFLLAMGVVRRGIHSVAQAEGICTFAEVCGGLSFRVSRASFWAMVRDLVLELRGRIGIAATAVRNALQKHARCSVLPRYTEVDGSPHTPPSLTRAPVSDGVVSEAAIREFRRWKSSDVRRCTVFISHLSPMLPQRTLMDILSRTGTVNKVRICRKTNFVTMSAFVEMSSEKEAAALLRLNRWSLMGLSIVVQTARNPIQDVCPEDAIVGANDVRLHRCRFGESSAPISQILTATIDSNRAPRSGRL